MTELNGKFSIKPVRNQSTGATGGTETMIPMRDGVSLMSDIYFPQGTGPWPAIVVRHPYGQPYGEDVYETIAEDGVVLVHQQCRGRFGSEGIYSDPYHVDADDGADTIEWIAAQSWCTGKVGIMGGSYPGGTTWLATMRQPKGLAASIPLNACQPFDAFSYITNGVCCLDALIMWAFALVGQYSAAQHPNVVSQLSPEFQRIVAITEESVQLTYAATAERDEEKQREIRDKLAQLVFEQNELIASFASGSLTDFLRQMEQLEPWVRNWAQHQVREDPYWANIDPVNQCEQIETPVLIVAGWYDTFTRTAVDNFVELTKVDGVQHRLVIGPWTHGDLSGLTEDGVVVGSRVLPFEQHEDRWSYFNFTSHLDTPALFQRWFRQHLEGEDSGLMKDAPIRLYVMGANEWRDEHEWPLARTRWTTYYLHSNGHANTLHGDGGLSEKQPSEEVPDQFRYDPADPVPSIGGRWLQPPRGGPHDRTPVQERNDVLVYTSEALTQPLEITGITKVKLWVKTSAVDTDFTATLSDVDKDGVPWILCDGVIRLRFRKEAPGLVTPGELQLAEFELYPISNLFEEGHQIRLEVSSSNGYYFDPNPNTGRSLLLDETQERLIANQTVFHDLARPSSIELPVIPSST